ncbi:MAG: PEP-CTERM sorting domain-containing protein [Bryobacteraceae bacterium]|nr:PEP-CTERM sorting domain-containing protein [Bryobacteraceae bacterium]MDW8379831.1 PEP-CTERM sorting domain-containing protein [Bryobacterales bacterium]
MFLIPGGRGGKRSLLAALGGLLFASSAPAAVVGQFVGNNPSNIWASSGNFSSIYAAALATGGHTIESPENITSSNLANNTHFIISNPLTGVPDLNALINWVKAGGILMMFVDHESPSSIGIINNILNAFGAGLSGSPLQVSTSQLLDPSMTYRLTASALAGSDPAVGSLAGAAVSMFNPFGVSGGNALAINLLGNALRVDHFQLGKVYVFGDNFASNANLSNWFMGSGMTNQQFFLNLLAQSLSGGGGGGSGAGGFDAPEPASLGLVALGLGWVAWSIRRRRDRA